MADTIVIETPVATVLDVSGLQGPQGVPGATGATGATGPQGPAGTGIETLTTKGDLLSRNDSTAIRVGIGSTGQVLKVASTGLPAWENESGGVPTSRTISAGTGLTGGGDLTANRTLSVLFGSAAGTACEGNDARLSDARTPSSTLAHAASHGPSGSDPLAHAFRVSVSSGSFSGTLLYAGESNGKPSWGESGQDVVTLSWNGTKWRLFPAVGGGFTYYESTDANIFSANWTIVSGQGSSPTPTLTFDFVRLGDFAAPVHTHVASDVTDIATVASSGSFNDLLDAPTLGTAAAADIGSGAGQVCAGDDARLSDTRTPSAHKNSHATGGTDALSAADIGAAAASHSHIPSEVGLSNVSNIAQVTSVTGTAPIVSSGGTTPAISVTVGTTANTVAAGDDSRIVGAAQKSANLSDLASASTARTNLGLGTAATAATGDFAAASHSHGNLTSAGAIGSTAGLPVVTTTSGAVTTLALGTANQVLKVNSGGTAVEFGAAGGVTSGSVDNAVLRADGTGGSTSQSSDIIIDDAATATQNNVSIRNNHSQTNSALVLCNKGTGAFIVSPARPDGTATGGNARGDEAVCIVPSRDNANQVASGAQAVAIGKRARASGGPSAAFGNAAAATGNGSCALGPSCSASSNDSFCAGNSASSTASGSVAIGWLASASGVNSFAAAGLQTSATLRAQFAVPAFNAVYWSGQTTTNAATILNLDGSATNRFTIAASTALAVDILLVARRATTQDKWLVARRFLGIRRDGSNNTALIGAVQTLGTDQSAGSPTWTFALTADDTNEALQLEVTGATGETVEWRATAFYRVA